MHSVVLIGEGKIATISDLTFTLVKKENSIILTTKREENSTV
jgi:hypothetical protein